MHTSDFEYLLPADRIAQHPLADRTSAKLLVLPRVGQALEQLEDAHVRDLPHLLRAGDLLVFNDSKVFRARLSAKKRSGSAIFEVFLLRPEGDIWQALVKRSKKLELGDHLFFADAISAEVIHKQPDGVVQLRFSVDVASVFALCEQYGEVPTPPYVQQTAENDTDYQTIYAKHVGSVAAPTAGFHFTDALMQELRAKGVEFAYVTLHVGLGTFRPMQDGSLGEHVMHSEQVSVSQTTIDAIHATKKRGGRVIAVGTTSTRSLESAASSGELKAYEGMTDIFIQPGHTFHVIDGLLTNFHLPKSTLLVLVSALAGRERVLAAYQHAIENNYRFYSFGDAMLIV